MHEQGGGLMREWGVHGTSDSLVAHRTVRCVLVTVGSSHVVVVDFTPIVGVGERR
jgi:hypothetical protein